MRNLGIFILCFLSQACSGTEYYFTVEDGKEVTSSILYKTDNLTLSYRVYNGRISRLNLSRSKKDNALDVKILKYEHTLVAGKTKYTPSIIGDYGLGVIDFPDNGWVTITSKLELVEKPEFMTESIDIEISIDGDLVKVSKEFQIEKGSYSRFEASH